MNDPDISSLMMAASERQLAVAALQKKYEQSESVPTEQLVRDMRELLSTERVVLDAIITLFVKLGHSEAGRHLEDGRASRYMGAFSSCPQAAGRARF